MLLHQDAKTEGVKDEVLISFRSILSSVLIALAGIVLLTDKLISFGLTKDQLFGFPSESSFIWSVSIPACVFLHTLGNLIGKPYKIAYLFPVWSSTVICLWIFSIYGPKDDSAYLNEYIYGSVVAFIALVAFSHFAFKKAYDIRNRKINAMQQALDLDLVPVVRELVDFIVLHIQKTYTPFLSHRMQIQFKGDFIELFRKLKIIP